MSLADLLRARTVAAIAAIARRADRRAGRPRPAAEPDSPPAAPARPPIRPGRRDRPDTAVAAAGAGLVLRAAVTGQPGLQLPGHGVAARRGEHRGAAAPRSTRSCAGTRSCGPRSSPSTGSRCSGRSPRRGRRCECSTSPPSDAEEAIAAELRTPFDLTRPPLARWLLLRHCGGENTLVHVEHHFVHDGWSLAVLLSELSALYQAFAAGQPSPLPDLARPVRGLRALAAGVDAGRGTEGSRGPLDRPAGRRTRHSGAAGRSPAAAGHELPRRGAADQGSRPSCPARCARSAGSTGCRCSRPCTRASRRCCTGTPGSRTCSWAPARRTASLPELEPLLGMIVNTLVLRTKVSGQMSFTTCSTRYSGPSSTRWPGRTPRWTPSSTRSARPATPRALPLFQVMFTFHDFAVPDLDFGGLTGAVTERANGSAKCRPQRDRGAAGRAAARPGAPARGRRPEPDLGALDRPVR